MKITNIKPQVKSTEKLSIFIDNKFAFPLSALEVSQLGLRAGMELATGELEELKRKSSINQAKARVLKLLSYRARSEHEIEDYLKRNKYTEDVREQIINYLKELNLIDDLAFARQWLKNRSEFKQNSFKQTRQELLQKGISREIVSDVLAENPIDELDLIKDLVAKKRRKSRYQDDMKLMQYLARRGYNYDKIKQALSTTEL